MSSNAPTIIDLKSAFLRTQVLALSKPLTPSASWQTSFSKEEHALRQRVVDDALAKLNAILKQHNRLSYGPQTSRHVAEQIDALYWSAGERGITAAGEQWTERGADYRNESNISNLPEQWSDEAATLAPEQAAKFQSLQQRLTELNEKRKSAKERLEQYKAAKKLLEPFEDIETSVQENVVTKNGEIEMELERSRMLMLRVERGISGLDDRDEDDMELDLEQDQQKRLAAFLGV